MVRWVDRETPIDGPNVKRPFPKKHKADSSIYDISGCNKVGKRILNEIISVYEEIQEPKDEAVFKHMALELDLPLRKAIIEAHEKAEKGGHDSAHISSGNVGHEGRDMFVRKTVKEINNMFE